MPSERGLILHYLGWYKLTLRTTRLSSQAMWYLYHVWKKNPRHF